MAVTLKRDYLTRKEEIILTTIDLIDELGISHVSVKEIAKREKVTDAALYKHFRSKENILLGVLEYYMKYDDYIIHTAEEREGPVRDKIFAYFQLYAEYYSSYPAITSITNMYGELLYQEEFSQVIKECIYRKERFVKTLLEEGARRDELIRSVTPENMAAALMGLFQRTIYLWRLEGYQSSLKERVEDGIGGLLVLYEKKA